MRVFRWVIIGAVCVGGIFLTVNRVESAPETTVPPAGAQPAEGPRVVPPAPGIPARAMQVTDFLAWDASQKEVVVPFGQIEVFFKFNLTNISKEVVTVHKVATSCGCTTAHLPPMPWALAPGTNGEINVTMNLAGKMGMVFKTVTVSTDKGNKVLMVKATMMPGGAGNAAMGDREQNQKLALADRQAVFKGDCARCHVEPGVGKMGKELYMAVCGVCHEAEHRASMVPDLHNLNHDMSRELWKVWITYGKPGSLMPAFAKSEGGPLSDEQIRSLTDYLAVTIPNKPGQAPSPAAPR